MAQAKNRPRPMRPWSPPVAMATKKDNRPLPMKPWTPDGREPRKITLAGTSRAVHTAGALSSRRGERRYLPCPRFAELHYCYGDARERALHEPSFPREMVSTWVEPQLPRVREYRGSRLEPRHGVGYHGNVNYTLTPLNHWGPMKCDLWRTESKVKSGFWHSASMGKSAKQGQRGRGKKRTTFSDAVQTFPGESVYQATQGVAQKQSSGRPGQRSATINDTKVQSLIDVTHHGGSSRPKATSANHKEVTSLIDVDNDVSTRFSESGRSGWTEAEVETLVPGMTGKGVTPVAMDTAEPKARRWYSRPKMDAYYYDPGLPPREEVGEEELSHFEDPPPEELGTGQVAKRPKVKGKALPVTKVKAVTTLSRLPPEVQAAVTAYKALHSRQ